VLSVRALVLVMFGAAAAYAAALPAYRYLEARQATPPDNATIVRDALLWFVVGLLIVWLGLRLLRRRLLDPLHDLDVALTRVAEGDLTIRVAADRPDERGRASSRGRSPRGEASGVRRRRKRAPGSPAYGSCWWRTRS
jgi:methyl-accepting chemotaxis protein